MQLLFADPYTISEKDIANFMVITFWNSDLFVRKSDGVAIKPDEEVVYEVPSMADKSSMDTVEAVALVVAAAGTGTIIVGAIASYCGTYSVNQLLSEVRSLSFITHFNMMQLSYPKVSTAFFAGIFTFVNFDILPADKVYTVVFGW